MPASARSPLVIDPPHCFGSNQKTYQARIDCIFGKLYRPARTFSGSGDRDIKALSAFKPQPSDAPGIVWHSVCVKGGGTFAQTGLSCLPGGHKHVSLVQLPAGVDTDFCRSDQRLIIFQLQPA